MDVRKEYGTSSRVVLLLPFIRRILDSSSDHRLTSMSSLTRPVERSLEAEFSAVVLQSSGNSTQK